MGRKVAGCVPVRKGSGPGIYEVLLVRSRWVEGIWLFPKGGVEKSETGKMSAIRETREEAGVIGRLGPKLGTFKPERNKEEHKMWLLFVEEEFTEEDKRWKEGGKRERKWYSMSDAFAVLKNLDDSLVRPELIQMLQKAEEKLKDVQEDNTVEQDDD